MMESLRNFLTGPTLIFVILICALPFVFLGTSSIGSVFGGSFGTINGEDVSEADLNIASNTALQRFKSAYGNDFDFDMLDEDVRAESIKQELIVQKVLQSGARSLGFINKNTINEAKKQIVQNPQFQVNGMFDENVYEAQVNSLNYTKEDYIDLMTNLIASELYRSSLNSLSFATDHEIFELTNLLEKTSDINYIKISFDGLKKELVNTMEELNEYYNNNQYLFYSSEKRNFKYIVLDQANYKNNIEVPQEYLATRYEDYLSKFENSAQTRISHIMIEKSSYESTQLALERIKEVEELLNAGNNFSELAGIYSEDIITKDIGGDLDYFEKDIFPVEFDLGIKDLKLNEISEIIELEDTFHILKVTEINIQEPLPENQIKDELTNELIETESLALMMDDFNATEEMIFDNSSIEDIADKLSKEVLISEFYTSNNYNFDISSQEVKEFLFSIDSQVNESIVIELDEKVIVMSISTIIEPSLQPYEIVAETVADLLSESKSLEKLALMENELKSIEDPDDKQVFIDAYNYVSSDVFIDVKRNSSLLPSEVLNEVFKNIPGTVINVDANNGDKYIVEINNFTNPAESDITAILDQYRSFSEERMSSKMSEIINEDAFESARVNLTNLAF